MKFQDLKMNLGERPHERCLTQGASCLSLRECVALLIGAGPAENGSLRLAADLLTRLAPDLEGDAQARIFFSSLERLPESYLSVPGLGDAGRARILASLELARRYADLRAQSKRQAHREGRKELGLPERALDLIPQAWRSKAREWLAFIAVDSNGKLGAFSLVEQGVRTHVNVDPIELFARVLFHRPQAFFLFHNHPSGDLNPSPQDEDITRRVDEVSRRLGIRLLGHGIITAESERWIVI